jgi:UDP-N-acetylmuramate dehydrogenase
LEWAVGVPGTMGGAVVNNAGAYGSDMARQLLRVELLSPTGERVWQPVEWFEYNYRTSRLKRQARREGQWIVLQAELQLATASVAEVEAKTNRFNAQRKASQPPGATIGSMFKNPAGDYAGRLIEAAGLKGYRCGQAQISPIHANFFQNLGGATASEVLNLIETAQRAVAEQFGITLELEIEVVGEPAAR